MVIVNAKSHEEAAELLKQWSADTGFAYSYAPVPFANEIMLYSAKSPCKLPDYLIETSGNRIGWQGQIVPFTKSAQIREQNRGIGRQ